MSERLTSINVQTNFAESTILLFAFCRFRPVEPSAAGIHTDGVIISLQELSFSVRAI